ncbi:centrosomal protein of 135 kDa-like [Elysia marginata]|uniref:Centrosomal protein of 135 kDa-like n=1 Tax=Elysia marginata TaxID=1093978 RepID=A0AAV4JWR7_9GAST|nr:centrosomal protein of 135 kDa-like [Elysia marginata]
MLLSCTGTIGMLEKLSNRDEEIERLTRMLDGGRPSDVVALEAKNRANERMISHLNIQVDYLQNKTRDYERKLRDATMQLDAVENKAETYQSKSRDLEYVLGDQERRAKQLAADKASVVIAADREMNEAKEELEKSRHELEDMDLTVAQMKAEQNRLMKELGDVRTRLTTREADNVRLEGLVDRITEEKKRLVQRANKLTANEKELVLEIERLKKKNGPTKKTKIPSKLDIFIRSIEEDRDYYRAQADDLQALLKGDIPRGTTKTTLRTRSASSSRTQSPSRKEAPAKTKRDVAQYEAIIRVMEEEKDYYKKEYEALKAARRSAAPIKVMPNKSAAEELELSKLTRERDELKSLLDKFERHMAEIQANVKVLTCERDKLNTMYEETKDELMKVRREIISSPKQSKTSLAAQAILRRIENERDDAISDLRRMTTERDSLRERLKIATETSLSDRAKLEQQVEDLEATLHTVEQERNELMIRMNTLKDEVKVMEEQIKDQLVRLSEVVEEASKNKNASNQMKLLVEETEKTLEDATRRLTRREEELHHQGERVSSLEEKVLEMQRVNQVSKEEIDHLRSNMKSMDREKDMLQAAVDEKTEKVAQLNSQLHDRHMQSHQAYEIQVSNLTRSVANLEENLRVTEEDKQELLSDVSAARELCSRLETSKESLNRQLAAAELDKEQLQNVISDLRQESDCMRSQIDQERASLKNLESLLQETREKDFQTQLSTQERNTEIQMLKDRLSLNESKLQGQSREVASLRTRNVELEGDIERMRRQLTSERFERERVVQELRRNGLQPPVMISDYAGSTRSYSPIRSRSRSPGGGRPRSRSRSPGVRFQTTESPNASLLSNSRRSYLYDDDRVRSTSPKTTSYSQDVL